MIVECVLALAYLTKYFDITFYLFVVWLAAPCTRGLAIELSPQASPQKLYFFSMLISQQRKQHTIFFNVTPLF